MTIGRLEVKFHVHWWSRWSDVYTGGEFGRLQVVADNHVLRPRQTRTCRCGAIEHSWFAKPRRRLTDEQLDKLGIYPE